MPKITSIFGSICDGFWTDFGGFSAPKIDQNRYQFRDRFLEGLKMVPPRLTIRSSSPRASPKDTFGVLTGPHTVDQLSGGPGTRDWGLVPRILHAVCRWHGEFAACPSHLFCFLRSDRPLVLLIARPRRPVLNWLLRKCEEYLTRCLSTMSGGTKFRCMKVCMNACLGEDGIVLLMERAAHYYILHASRCPPATWQSISGIFQALQGMWNG